MSYDFVAIDDICELVRGSSPRPQGGPRYFGGSVPRLMVADMTRDGMYVTPSIDSLTEEGAKQSRPMKAGEVVMVVSGLVGLPSILKIDACIHDGLVGFRNLDEKVLSEFLYYWLLSSQEKTRTQTAGAIWQNLTTDQIKEWKIPLPPLTEQKRIASLLARADRLRHLRRTAQELGESLLQSVFLEMLEKARGKMKEVKLGTLAEVKTGGTPSRDVPEYFNGNIPWVKTTEVVNEVIYRTSEKISEAGLKASNCEVFPIGTILLAMYGQGLTRGRTGKLGIPATTNQACAAILPSKKIDTDYLWTYLKLSYNEIRDLGRGGNQPNLNLSMVRDLIIPVPPLNLQEEFASVVARVESMRSRQAESERQVNGLFESLLSQIIGG